MESDVITQAVSERYARAVTNGEEMCCPTGYNHEDLRTFIPEPVLKVSYGCGTPVGLTTVQPGETVLDIGSGGGIDCFEASRRVGPTGRVIGIDMTDEMLALARTHAPTVAANLGYPETNVDFRKGQAEAMPVDDEDVDLIVSNCVINLSPDKPKVFQEMFRILRPGGRFSISDIVSDQAIPNYMIYDKEKWGDCLSGALPLHEYWGGLRDAGFLGIHQVNLIPWRVIDGIHFLSITLTGYKLTNPQATSLAFATLKGPFTQVTDERGHTFKRGIPESIDTQTATLLQSPLYDGLFVLTETPEKFTGSDSRWSEVLPEDTTCVWDGHFAMLTGPFLEARDDDDHTFLCGVPLEICSKTHRVLQHATYQPYFGVINRASQPGSHEAIICEPTGGCC
ncbi:MAG: methyltransferase domain-containing protein [Nitrospirae bacterium]|nr:methyltransferase domain-containing protein [Nitrospirota bacterium]MDA1304999.1 methyltransferase domain-containing protein [Nitrospirota bacterium]